MLQFDSLDARRSRHAHRSVLLWSRLLKTQQPECRWIRDFGCWPHPALDSEGRDDASHAQGPCGLGGVSADQVSKRNGDFNPPAIAIVLRRHPVLCVPRSIASIHVNRVTSLVDPERVVAGVFSIDVEEEADAIEVLELGVVLSTFVTGTARHEPTSRHEATKRSWLELRGSVTSSEMNETQSTPRLNQLCDIVRETSFAIHVYHRNGHLEKVYENALVHRLRKQDLKVRQQHRLNVYDEDGTILGEYFAELFVEDCPIVDSVKQAVAGSDQLEEVRTDLTRRAIGHLSMRLAGTYAMHVFGKPDRAVNCDCERVNQPTLLQSIFLHNDPLIEQRLENSGWVTEIADRESAGRMIDSTSLVREAWLRTVNRPPTATELKRAEKHLARSESTSEGLRDLLWALINTKEFILN